MKRNAWTAWLIVSIICLLTPLWPIGIILLIYTLVKGNKDKANENRLSAQIDLIARQLGIEYGSAEEKLEQIAKIAVTQGNRE